MKSRKVKRYKKQKKIHQLKLIKRRRNPAKSVESMSLKELREEVEAARDRINAMRQRLASFFIGKNELIDLMCVSLAAQEPFLLVGRPGTGKSDLIVKFCEAIGVKKPGEKSPDFFEYMLTKFTEPGEILGPVDIQALKSATPAFRRKMEGMLPTCKVAFLDEIFKANSAILNTLLSAINERKIYQEGRAISIPLIMLFAATNRIPETEELEAIRDRFILKAESVSVKDEHFQQLITKGMSSEIRKSLNQRPWADLASLDDFIKVKRYLDFFMGDDKSGDEEAIEKNRKQTFSDPLYNQFQFIIRALEREEKITVSDRKLVKLYRLIRTRAFLFHGGVVRPEDLSILGYIGDRAEDLIPVKEKVTEMLSIPQPGPKYRYRRYY